MRYGEVKKLKENGLAVALLGESQQVEGFAVVSPVAPLRSTTLLVSFKDLEGCTDDAPEVDDDTLIRILQARGVKQKVIGKVFGKSQSWVSQKLAAKSVEVEASHHDIFFAEKGADNA